jgi:YHS domain-containing protein
MADVASLASRIDTEFSELQKRVDTFQKQAEQEYAARETRYREQFLPAAKRLADVLRPRLQVLADKFKDQVRVAPTVTEHLRQVLFTFNSRLARIELTFSLSHDLEVRNLVLDQTLDVLPILMQFDKHASLTVPLDAVDEGKISRWVDDRIVAFVQTFMAIHQNQYYQKGHLVTDPVAGIEMPQYAARCTLESGGKTYYFVSEATRAEYLAQQKK